jgi:pimeloyl-ACP methyl ester carboxylesterase
VEFPETRYVKVGEVHIAYQTVGEGPVDLVYVPGIFSHLDYQWEEPSNARFLRRFAEFSRLIMFDPRGVGLSDRAPELPILEEQMDDLRAVLDATGSERPALLGVSQGGPMAILFAATHPGRTSALVLFGAYAAVRADADYPWGRSPEWLAEFTRQLDESWGTGSFLTQVAPTRAEDESFRRWWGRLERFAASPGNALAFARMNIQTDIRHVLPVIGVPTLLLQRRGDVYRNPGNARYLADHIPGSKLVELPGIDHLPFVGDSDAIVEEIQEFLIGVRRAAEPERVLATVLFTDVVGSTEKAAALGDRRWRDLLDEHNAAVRRELERFRGREVDVAGDGFLATFDGPARAIRCAVAVREAVRPIGIDLRAGLHSGEVDLAGEGVRGIAVHIGARVARLARPGEVLVSSTVKDLVVGSGIEFEARGIHELKGVPGEWQLFAVGEGA